MIDVELTTVTEVAAVPPETATQVVQTAPASWALTLFGIDQVQKIDTEAIKTLPNAEKDQVLQAEAKGAAMAFRKVSMLPILLFLVFAGIAIRDRLTGGYRAELLLSPREKSELFAGGVQAPVE